MQINYSLPETWPSLLTLNQTSKLLSVHPATLRRWDELGKLKAVRMGSRRDRRYRKEDILKIINNGL